MGALGNPGHVGARVVPMAATDLEGTGRDGLRVVMPARLREPVPPQSPGTRLAGPEPFIFQMEAWGEGHDLL